MYKWRIKVFLITAAVMLLTLAVRVGYLQLVCGDEYLEYARQRLGGTEMLPSMRGRILDRGGRILAIDEPCYDLCIEYPFLVADPNDRWTRRMVRKIAKANGLDRKNKKDMSQAREIYRKRRHDTLELANRIARTNGLDLRETIRKIINRVERIRGARKREIREQYQYHAIAEGLDEKAAVEIKARLAGTMCMKIRLSHKRKYPRGSTASHVIGTIGKVNASELAKFNRGGSEGEWLDRRRDSYAGDDVIGKSGVEKMAERLLRGRKGYRIYQGNEPIASQHATPGGDVHLTLDAELQEELFSMFIEKAPQGTGAIVVLDVSTAEVLALVSVPTYDLNSYRQDFSRLLSERVRLPLRNRAISHTCAPGSTVKPVAALCALGSGRIDTKTKFTCKDGYMFSQVRDRWRCWSAPKGFGHGRIDMIEGIRHSCNVYFYHVGQSMGPRLLCDWLKLFGFGALPGTGLPEELPGVVPTDEWMRQRYDRAMSIGDARLMAIGQGPFSATPLQVGNAMATIARGGQFISPVLVLEAGPDRIRRDLPIAEHHIQAVHDGMRDVVHHPNGTAHKYVKDGLDSLGFEFCGKTGTATVPPQRIDSDGDGRITRADTIVRRGDAAWFAGFAPYRNPKIAFAVLVEYVEGGGGANAAPIALDIIRICKKKKFGYVP